MVDDLSGFSSLGSLVVSYLKDEVSRRPAVTFALRNGYAQSYESDGSEASDGRQKAKEVGGRMRLIHDSCQKDTPTKTFFSFVTDFE